MPLDTSTYSLALLRVDGRRWNELRRIQAQIRTQASSDGSSYLEMGHTKVMCVVTGPSEPSRRGPAATAGGSSAALDINISIAGFSGIERKKRGKSDKRLTEMCYTIGHTLKPVIQTNLFPHSTITVSLTVLSQDGSLLAALFNAATLALIDAGIPMTDYVCACTSGSTSTYAAADDQADPLFDLNQQEEQELPYVTIATLGKDDRVATLVCESRVQISRLEGMMAVGVSGCHEIRQLLDSVVRERGKRMIAEGVINKSETFTDDTTTGNAPS